MRRLATVVPVVVAALAFMGAPALASSHGPSHAKPTHATKAHKAHKPKKAHNVTFTGVISDTPTAAISSDSSTSTITPTSDTATSTITVKIKGGTREFHGQTVVLTLDRNTVVRRGGPATAADLQKGDHVSVKARKQTDGSWYAYRVNASPMHDD